MLRARPAQIAGRPHLHLLTIQMPRRCPSCRQILADLKAEDILDLPGDERRRALELLQPKAKPETDPSQRADKIASTAGRTVIDARGRVRFVGPSKESGTRH